MDGVRRIHENTGLRIILGWILKQLHETGHSSLQPYDGFKSLRKFALENVMLSLHQKLNFIIRNNDFIFFTPKLFMYFSSFSYITVHLVIINNYNFSFTSIWISYYANIFGDFSFRCFTSGCLYFTQYIRITFIFLSLFFLRILRGSATQNRLIFQLCFIILKIKLYVCRILCENFIQIRQ